MVRSGIHRHVVVLQCPFPHVSYAFGHHPVDNQFGVVDRTEVLSQQWVVVPDLFQDLLFGDHLGVSGDPDLVMPVIDVAQFDVRVGLDLGRLGVAAEVGDVNGEAVGVDR